MARPVVWLAILTAGVNLFAQTNGARSLGELVLSETSALDAAPDLARWRTLHPKERLKPAAYDNEYDLRCAASVADVALPGGAIATRLAFFYVPSWKPGDALPARQDPGLVQRCRLLALWYEVHDPADPGGLVKSVSAELAASLGPAEELPRFSSKKDGDWGSGYWNPYLLWTRANRRVVLAFDPGGNVPDPTSRTRLLVIVRASQAPRGFSIDWMGGAKGQPSLKEAAANLAARGSPGERKAAALVLADLSVKRPTELGAGPKTRLSQAEQIDPTGPAGEIARIAHVEQPCDFDDGSNNWQDGLIRFGEKLLRDFPESRWKIYVHLTMARAYAAKLILTYPDMDLNGANRPTDPEALRRNAIVHFRAFLEENREASESGVAWGETWRLLAGLPPSLIHFACTD